MGGTLSRRRRDTGGGGRRRRGRRVADETRELCNNLIKELKTARNSLNCDQEEDTRKRLITFFESLRSNGTGVLEFFSDEKLEDIQKKHISFLDQFKVIRGKIQKKLSRVKRWRKVSKVLSTVLVNAIHIISVVVVSVGIAPPHLLTVAASVTVLLEQLGNSVDSVWESFEKTIEEQMKLTEQAHAKGDTMKKDLDDIKTAFDKMKIQIIELLETSGGMDERKMEEAGKSLKALVELFDKTVDDIQTAETVLLMVCDE